MPRQQADTSDEVAALLEEQVAELLAEGCTLWVGDEEETGEASPSKSTPADPPAEFRNPFFTELQEWNRFSLLESPGRRKVSVSTVSELLGALQRPNTEIDLGGRTLDLTGRVCHVRGGHIVLANGTIKCGGVVVQDTANMFRCAGVTFAGIATTPCAHLWDLPRIENFAMLPLVCVDGAQAVSFDGCTFRDCDNAALCKQMFGPATFCVNAGLHATHGARVSLRKSRICNIAGHGLVATSNDTIIFADDVECVDCGSAGGFSSTLAVLHLKNCAFARNAIGVESQRGGSVQAAHTVCEDNRVSAVRVTGGSCFELEQCRVARNPIGIGVSGEDSTATISNTVCEGASLAGVLAGHGGACDVHCGEVRDCAFGLLSDDRGSRSSGAAATQQCSEPASDCGEQWESRTDIRAVRLTVRSCEKGGVVAARGGHVDLTRCTVDECWACGVRADGEETRVAMKDVDVARCLYGVEAVNGGTVAIDGGAATENMVGVIAKGERTFVKAVDVLCARNRCSGMVAGGGSNVVARGCALMQNKSFGVLSSGQGSIVALEDTLTIGNGEGATESDEGGQVNGG